MTTDVIITIIVAFFGSNGLWALMQSIYNKRDKTQDKLDLINEKVDKINNKVDMNNATLARTHILRFSDELINGIDHSNEYFKQTLQDIDTYNTFCEKNPTFKNSMTELASENIKDTYKRLLKKGEFKHE
jgi:TRAP-type uncharacterized transport system substrate-binding protein